MAVLIHLSENGALRVKADYASFLAAYEQALENSRVLEVTDAGGVTRAVNPRQIVYFEQVEDEETVPGSAARRGVAA